jgi:hypothetical protein
MSHRVDFEGTEEGMRLMAAFVAQLVREGVTYKIEGFSVEILGGY